MGVGTNDSFRSDETIQALMVEMGALLRECKGIAHGLKTGRPSRRLTSPSVDFAPPSRDVADAMAKLYFESFESVHRILHAPTFWTEYRRYWTDSNNCPISLRLKVLLVIGIGSILSDYWETDSAFRSTVQRWVYAAQAWLSGPLEKDRLDISGLQIHCLTIIARQLLSIGGDLVWMSMGSLVHRAMQIGLHRDPEHLPAMPVLQAELRRRLWATILELVVQSSLDAALPPRISLDEFDTKPPANINDEDMDGSTEAVHPRTRGIFTATSMQLMLLDSLPSRLRALQLLNSISSELDYVQVLTLSSEITEAHRRNEAFLKDNEGLGPTVFYWNLTDFFVRRFLMPLHCSCVPKARVNPLFTYSIKISLDTALSVFSPEPDPGFARLMARSGGMYRDGLRQASSVITAEYFAQLDALRLDGTLHRGGSQRLQPLKQAVIDMKRLSLERIEQGETNVKGYMFACMVDAQAEASVSGESIELRMAEAARDSLLVCRDLLQRRLDAISTPSYQPVGLLPSNSQALSWFDLDLEYLLTEPGYL
ncbi:hypothetical protein ANO11243_010410 [Dothideomycetidae sp. 11243]|nr:hypothetical protein ANO11243_010410 [fungal sp. No.11243]